MTSSLLDEALADAKSLREAAEQNAKNAIIESITPKIRALIDKQILGEDVDDGDFFEGIQHDLQEDAASLLSQVTPQEGSLFERSEELKDNFSINEESLEGLINIANEWSHESKKLSEDHARARDEINQTVDFIPTFKKIQERIIALNEHFAILQSKNPAILRGDNLKVYLAEFGIAEQAVKAFEEIINSNHQNSGYFGTEIQNMHDNLRNKKREINEMKKSLRELLSEEVVDLRVRVDLGDVEVPDLAADDVTIELSEELPAESEEGEEAGEEEGGEEEVAIEVEDEEVEVEADEAVMLEVSADELREQIRNMVQEAMGPEDVAEGELEEILAELEEGEDEGAHTDAMEEEMDALEEDYMSEGLDDDTVLEISETMLRDELAKMLSESSDEEAEELVEAAQEPTQEIENEYATTINELQSQLSEMNLFNAKLLYTNKLLLSDELTKNQKVRAIESLDEAKSLREVKLLYKGLTSSAPKKTVNESASRIAGSASRATKPSSTLLNESAESKRWSILAGLN